MNEALETRNLIDYLMERTAEERAAVMLMCAQNLIRLEEFEIELDKLINDDD